MADDLTATARDLTARLVRVDTTAATAGEIDGLRLVAGCFAGRDDVEVRWHTAEDGEPLALLVLPADGPRDDLLLFSGHVDTVPASSHGWKRDPWGAEIEDGWLHGRGTSDMKSGLAAQIAALLAAPAGSRAALAVSRNEENGCQGTVDVVAALRAAGAGIGALIVGEPTDGELILGHKGPLWLDVTTTGVAAHGSTPERGVSAIAKMADVLTRMADGLPLRTHPGLGRESVNVGTITGGTLRNIVPERCRIEVDLRTVDPDPSPLVGWFEAQPEVDEVRVAVHLPALWTDPDDPWVATLSARPAGRTVGYGTEAGPLAAEFGIARAVVWGPGPTAFMHVVDEAVRLADIDAAAVGYLDAIRAWRG